MSSKITGKKRSRLPRIDSLSDFIVSEDEDYDPNYGNYFQVDTKPLQQELITSISAKLNLDVSKVSRVVSEVFTDMTDLMLDDYIPTNNQWKLGTDKRKIKKLEPELKKLRDEMSDEIPTILRIMEASITKADKKQCLRLYYQLQYSEQYTENYFRLIDQINNILGKASSENYKEILELEKKEERIKQIFKAPDNLRNRILKLDASDDVIAKLLKKYYEMNTYPSDSSLHLSLREEIEWGLRMPYQKKDEDIIVNMNSKQLNRYFCEIRDKLDNELYAMDKVKDRIIHILNDRRTSGDMCGRNLALVSSPGCGKTKICKVLGDILNKPVVRISVGALDSAALKGSNKVWQGSEPSIVLQKLAEIGTNNCIMVFDEVDKLGETPQGKLAQHALLHISDPDNNNEFQDNYLKNFTHDLSKVFFIYLMNSDQCLDPATKDRFDIIYLDDYTKEEKKVIFKDYMLPKALITVGMKKKDIQLTDSTLDIILKKDISLRTVENIIKNIVGKINMYRSVILPDGTLGNLKLSYNIPNFKLPLRIGPKLVRELMK